MEILLKILLQYLIMITGWTGLLILVYTNLTIVRKETGQSVLGALVTYCSYFTILSNYLVVLAITIPLMAPSTRLGRFFSDPRTLSGVLVYIGLVGVLYHLLLADLWDPQGIRKIANRITHNIIPVLFLLYWVLFVPKGALTWNDALRWIIFPLGYYGYIMGRGAIFNIYPYPFLDRSEHGVVRVMLFSLAIIGMFLVSSLLLIGLDKMFEMVI
jgi:hypothetical protein